MAQRLGLGHSSLQNRPPAREGSVLRNPPYGSQARAFPGEGSRPTEPEEFLPSSSQSHSFYLGFWQPGCFFKEQILFHCKQKGIQAPGPWVGASVSQPQSLGCLLHPGSILPPEPGRRPPAHTQALRCLPGEGGTGDRRRHACSVGTCSPGIRSGQKLWGAP